MRYAFTSPSKAERDRVALMLTAKGAKVTPSQTRVYMVHDDLLRPVEQRLEEPDDKGYEKLNAARWTVTPTDLFIVESDIEP